MDLRRLERRTDASTLGSMKPGNAADLLAQAGVDGGLIGGASLDAGQFLAIVEAAAARV